MHMCVYFTFANIANIILHIFINIIVIKHILKLYATLLLFNIFLNCKLRTIRTLM